MKREYKVLFLFFLIFLSIFIVRMIDFVIIPTIFVPHISNEEIASARNGSQFMGEKRIQKEMEIDDLLERVEKGENLWDGIIEIENEISSIKEKEGEYRETHITLAFLKRLEKIRSIGIGIYGIRYNGSIVLFYPKVNLKQEIDDIKKEMDNIRKEIDLKEEKLNNLYNNAKKEKEGDNTIEEIQKLRSEIKELERKYNDKRETYLEIKLTLDMAFVVI